jgi:hypothetical protein
MIDQQNHTYDERAREYEQKARRVSDAWVREKYLALAKRCREMKKAPKSQETRSRLARIER